FLLFALDYRVFLFSFAIALLATLIFGLAPALQATRTLRFSRRPGRVFIAAQVAATCVLLVISGLLTRSMQRALGQDLGFEFDRVIALDPQLSLHGYQPAEAAAFWEHLRAQVSNVPGVESMTLCTNEPFGAQVSVYYGPGNTYTAYATSVDPSYFSTLAIPLRSGRGFAPGDKNVVIVGEKLARLLWPGVNPLGKPWGNGAQVVVGVAAPARTIGMRDAESTEVYFPLQPDDERSGILLVKTSGPPETVLPHLRAIASEQDSRLFPSVSLLKDSFHLRLQSSQRGAQVVSALGILAALLAAAGVYGQVCYAVAQKQKEIGVRVALGARPSGVIAVVLRHLYGPVVMGAAVGLGIAAGVSLLLRRELYGLSHLDLLSYAGAVGLLLVVALVAALVPARRALRVDPIEVLRYE
ncbi:MAG TPA: ABC transporter permease, partial [Candidatus Acidoferrales bacterium]